MQAAQKLLDKVQMEKPTLVQSIRQLSVSHLRKQQHGTVLYNTNHIHTFISVPVQFPPSCKLVKLSCLNEVAVPTVDIKVHTETMKLCYYYLCYNVIGRSYLSI